MAPQVEKLNSCLFLVLIVFWSIVTINLITLNLSLKMSVNQKKSTVQLGDHLFIFLSPKQMYPLTVIDGETFQTKYGPIKHLDLVGVKYGSKLNLAKGWVHILPFTPELWTLNLPHRTQILYSTDISMIIGYLNLKPGSIVIESGTGSGSLSHSIIRTIAPNGFLYTFDFHLDRANKAREEMSNHGLGNLVKVTHRDVCQDGFDLKQVADALFLDLPHPWQAIPFAYEAMKPRGSRLCCFSPCIEQVQKTCLALRSLCFIDIETIELVQRPFEAKSLALSKFNFQQTQDKESLEEDLIPCKDDDKDDDDAAVTGHRGDGLSNKKLTGGLRIAPSIHITGHTGFLTFASKI